MIVIRGAVTCDNSKESIISAVGVLTDKIFELNDLNKDRLSAVIFSMTKDLAAYNAATAFRESGLGDVYKRQERSLCFVARKQTSKIPSKNVSGS